MEWARSRKAVRLRHSTEPDPYQDPPESAEACLTLSERKRLVGYVRKFPREMGDLGQDPLARPLATKG
eukprot:14396169-Alexandrium_andersonii.AAC.1